MKGQVCFIIRNEHGKYYYIGLTGVVLYDFVCGVTVA
jgi:hypothetical protein